MHKQIETLATAANHSSHVAQTLVNGQYLEQHGKSRHYSCCPGPEIKHL
jgi:hypothetical protein